MPNVTDINVSGRTLSCVFRDASVSLPNAIRRAILAQIPCIVLDTSREGESELQFVHNDTSQTNEMLAQRFASIPVHETDVKFPWQDYSFKIDVENKTEDSRRVTSGDITIHRRDTGAPLAETERNRLFPSDPLTGDYIEIATLPGHTGLPRSNRLQVKGVFSIGKASENGAYAVATEAICAGLQDKKAAAAELKKRMTQWKAQGLTMDDTRLRQSDFELLDAHRYVVPDTFKLVISSVGVFSPEMLVARACSAISDDLSALAKSISDGHAMVTTASTTIPHCYDVALHENSNTVGRLIESTLYTEHYSKAQMLSYCGFVKPHPHHESSVVRFAFVPKSSETEPVAFFLKAIEDCLSQISGVAQLFSP